jgi:hypothetical protein
MSSPEDRPPSPTRLCLTTPGQVMIPPRSADLVWTKNEFLALCGRMHNGNAETEFMHVYRDPAGQPRFVRSKTVLMQRRATWAWDTIVGRAKNSVGIGFYPCNPEGKSRWGAMDFDAHDGNGERPRELALAALEEILRQTCTFYPVLATSGSAGWHLFVFSEFFHPIGHWTRLLKQVASCIGTKIIAGICEIFPQETRQTGALPYGIRAPGTWNPKTDEVGLIACSSVELILNSAHKKKEEEESPFLYRSTYPAEKFRGGDGSNFYRGGRNTDWLVQFGISQSGTRHMQLKGLMHTMFREVGYRVARHHVNTQYLEAKMQPTATLAEHLEEFEELWNWTVDRWREELSTAELDLHNSFTSTTERDLFRILRNFAKLAAELNRSDFAFPLEHVASRLGVTFQHVSKLRQKFTAAKVISQTAAARANSAAARYRWCAPGPVV